MDSTGGAEFSGEENKDYKPAIANGHKTIQLTFWPSFLLTLAGVAGLISMLFDGPRWITYPAFVIVIGILLWTIYKVPKSRK